MLAQNDSGIPCEMKMSMLVTSHIVVLSKPKRTSWDISKLDIMQQHFHIVVVFFDKFHIAVVEYSNIQDTY